MVENIYPMPNATNLADLAIYVQNYFPFVELLLLAVFIISFVSLKNYESLKAFAASIFITFIACFICVFVGIAPTKYVYVTATLLGISAILLYLKE